MTPRLASVTALLAALAGCGSSLPVPRTGPHLPDEPMLVVPFPQPPARVEIVPPPPPALENAVWLDGEWQWRGRRWVWLPGRWEVPYPGAYFAPATTIRRADGELVFFAGTWHFPEDSQPAAPPAPPPPPSPP